MAQTAKLHSICSVFEQELLKYYQYYCKAKLYSRFDPVIALLYQLILTN